MSSGTITPGGTETNIVETAVESDGLLELVVDLSNMAGGDTVRFRVFRRVDGTNYRREDEVTLSGAQSDPVFNVGRLWCSKEMKIKVTIQQTTGTSKSFAWRSRVMH